MEKDATTEKRTADWSALLTEAVTKPGIISAAYSVFHAYSIGNQILAWSQITKQNLELSPLATFKKWGTLGRRIKQGSKAIHLYIPVTFSRKDDENNEETITGFACRPNWFSLSQTEGQDFQFEVKTPAWDKSRALKALDITEVTFSMLDGNCQGFAHGRNVAVNPVAQYPHKTRFHELAHVVLGHTTESAMQDGERTPRDIREVEAEGVAYILCSILNLPGLEESRGYIQHWMKEQVINAKSAKRIFGTAEKIIKAGQ